GRHRRRRGPATRCRGQPQQALVVGDGRPSARDRARPAGPGRGARGRVVEGLAVRAVGPDLRRHQRDPAQHRRRADPRPSPPVGRVHFGFTDDELLLRDAVRALFERECPPDAARAAWDAESLDRRVWDALAQMGVPGVLIAEASGGLGLDELSLVLLLEESGRVALPHPLVETAAVAAPLLGAGLGARLVATDLGGGHLVPCAGDADVLLLRAPDGLRAFDAAAVTVVGEPTAEHARRAGRVTFRPEA